ncbi:MAG TPA: MFS transporter [Kofleriaceae bacterium]|nr:MFS transporter [Kofleriaceae bacterium]
MLEIFLIFFQAFMVAPLLPRLSALFAAPVDRMSLLIPAYTLPYGCVCLAIGPVADRHGRARVLGWLVAVGVALPALTATAASLPSLLAWRVIAGVTLGGVTPIGLALIASLFPYAERGRPVGWVFGAIAGGMALGATLGPWLEPAIGWRGTFVLVSAANLAVAVPMWRTLRALPPPADAPPALGARAVIRSYVALIGSQRGRIVFGYIFLNGAFHSGVFSWLGVYFHERYQLEPRQLGYALLGYGIPGFLLGPVVGRLADRFGRRWLIRGGLTLAGACALTLAAPLPVVGATVAITALSLGMDLSHPLFSGMVSALDPVRTAQAMAVSTFAIFIGFGAGSVVFGAIYGAIGMTGALVLFAIVQLSIAAASLVLFDRTWR